MKQNPLSLFPIDRKLVRPHGAEYTDTDPQMLFAMWDTQNDGDPDQALDALDGAEVVYDKFRPRLGRTAH